MQMSLNLQAALLARAVYWSEDNDECAFEPFDFINELDALEKQEFSAIVNTLESITLICFGL